MHTCSNKPAAPRIPAAPKATEGPASLAAILAYITFFALGAGPIPCEAGSCGGALAGWLPVPSCWAPAKHLSWHHLLPRLAPWARAGLYMPEVLPVELMGMAQVGARAHVLRVMSLRVHPVAVVFDSSHRAHDRFTSHCPLAQAFCTALNWASNLLVSSTFPMMLAALGIAGTPLLARCREVPLHGLAPAVVLLAGGSVELKRAAFLCPAPWLAGSYLFYAALNAVAAAFLARRMVETKQQPVERIRALLMGENS